MALYARKYKPSAAVKKEAERMKQKKMAKEKAKAAAEAEAARITTVGRLKLAGWDDEDLKRYGYRAPRRK